MQCTQARLALLFGSITAPSLRVERDFANPNLISVSSAVVIYKDTTLPCIFSFQRTLRQSSKLRRSPQDHRINKKTIDLNLIYPVIPSLKSYEPALLIPYVRSVYCGADRDRTGNLWLAKPALSQLSYGPWFLNYRNCRNRDRLLANPVIPYS